MEYIIKAHCPATNETQREINLMMPAPTDAVTAEQLAASFAQRMNARTGRTDWIAQVEMVNSHAHARTL